ncbi:hypothetical protein [Rhodanobacter sp. C01]|uniref:hypothetical protein n=1 Tax=Rhodanobacter sp. C01 TaxID=1945856 RepID=UPI001115736D|nr:hypothetical protein [Rhodanobacter sp. C01]
MERTKAANLALLLVALGWLLAFYGVMSQVGDPGPTISPAQIDANRLRSFAILLVGIVCLLSSLWLSGYSFMVAKVRSIVSAAAVVLPSIGVVLSLL